LLASIDSQELSEWMAFARIEPIGSLREDLRAGTIAAVTANVSFGKKSKAFEPEDFFHALRDRPHRRATVAELKSAMDCVKAGFPDRK
jgi:hypothetical protein